MILLRIHLELLLNTESTRTSISFQKAMNNTDVNNTATTVNFSTRAAVPRVPTATCTIPTHNENIKKAHVFG